MKKSNSENSFHVNTFNAKPPVSANTANISSRPVRMGQNSYLRPSGPTSPTSAPSDSSPYRSTSSSPRRHISPDCSKLKLVSAGNSFCLVKDEQSPVPSDDIKNGRKSPFISSRSWPKALRTRSASKERIYSRQGILQSSIEQIKAFQEAKSPETHFPSRYRDSKSDSSCDRSSLTKSTSLACLSRPSLKPDGPAPKGILKTNNYPQVPRVNERIKALQINIDDTKSKPTTTLPWNSKLCKDDSSQSLLRKTASSPCLFVEKSCIKIKTGKLPLKLYSTMSSTISNVGNFFEEKLSHVESNELNEWESNKNQQHTLRDTACMGKSHEWPEKTVTDEVPDREIALQDRPLDNSIPCGDRIKTYDEVGRTIEILDSEEKSKGELFNEQQRTAENVSCIQNEQLKFSEITLQNKILHDDIPKRGSIRTSNKEIFKNDTANILFPQTMMVNKDFLGNSNVSGNSILTESEDSDRPQNSTCLLSKQIGLPSGLSASGGISRRRTCNEPTQSQTCDKLVIKDPVSCDPQTERKTEIIITKETGDGDGDMDKVSQLGKDFKSPALADKQDNNGKLLNTNNAEHINSSEDEEIQKELSSILTNGHKAFKGQFPEPRSFNNPFMNDVTVNRQSLKNLVISESKFVGSSDSADTRDDVLQDRREELDLNISKNTAKSSFDLTSELEGDISKISINAAPRPIISLETAKLISFPSQEREGSVDGKANGIKECTKSATKITHLGNRGVGVHNMYGAVPRLLGSKQFRSEREAVKSDPYTSTCEIQLNSGIVPAQRKDEGLRKIVYGVRKNELEQSDLSESSSRQDESSPPRDSPSPESSSSDNEVSDDEFSRIRQRSFNTRRGSMPEREIDEEDTETAELQVNLRKISGRSFIPSVKLASVEKDDNENISPETEANETYLKEQNNETKEVSPQFIETNILIETEIEEQRHRPDRRGSMPEREINEDDTETAEFQTNLRKLSAKSGAPNIKSLTEYQSLSDFEDEITPEIENIKDCQSTKEIQLKASIEATKDNISTSMDLSEENKQIFRPAIPARGRTPGGLRRSRTWQGFGSGLRYESVSDAGLPPPPPTPNGAKGSEGVSHRQVPSTRQSLPRSYRPLSNLRRNPESGPKSWRRPTGSAFPSTAPVVGHSTVRSLGEQGGIARSLSEGNVLQEWDESDEEVEYECRVTCSVRQPNQDGKMSVDHLLSEDSSDNSKVINNPVEMEDKGDEDNNGREDLTPAQIQQLMSVIAGMESIKRAGGEDSTAAGTSGSPPPTDEEIQQFIEYVGMGVINNDRLEYEERRKRDQEEENQPEPPKRNKQASQYFWRRHYLSIIQEDEEEHNEQTPGSSRSCSRANSRPGSTYENNFNRLSRVLGAMSPLALEQRSSSDTVDKAETIRDVRASWGSEMSVDSLTSVNSILSEEGSITSNGSFSDTCQTDLYQNITSSDQVRDNCQKRASQSLSCLLDSVHPPSNTPDSMMSCESPTVRLSKSEMENEDDVHVIKFKMGSKFKQSIQEIEESKRKDGEDESESSNTERGDTCCSTPGDTTEGRNTLKKRDSNQSGRLSITPTREGSSSPSGRIGDTRIQVDTILKVEEAQGGEEVMGDIKQSFLRLAVNPLASPRQGRKNLTISTLIAECEEYVKTDEFTKDLSDKLVTLFRGETSKNSSKISNPVVIGNQDQVSTKSEQKVMTPISEESDKMKKPPKIPDSMRTKTVPKTDRTDKSEKNEKNNIPKFPLNLRGSTYDNVGDSEAEDEGIDNDYSDDSGTATTTSSACSFCQLVGCEKHESSPALTSEGYDSAYESDKKHVPGDLGFQDSEKSEVCENRSSKLAGITEHKKQSLNPFLTSEEEENSYNPFETEIKNTNPFENDCDSLNPFVKDDDNNPFNEDKMSTSQGSVNGSLTASQLSIEEEMTISNESFEDYESVISDIEETLSILSRNSRSTTPASEMGFDSRTPTPSFGQINYFSMSDLSQKGHKSVSDKHVIPIVTVFDDLKDYLSDSDLSLDYKIALQRRKHKNLKNLNKQAQLSSFLTSKKSKMDAQELPKFKTDKTRNDDNAHQDRLVELSQEYPTRSLTCPNIFHQAQSCLDSSPQVSPNTTGGNYSIVGTKTLPNISLCKNTSTKINEIPNCREMTLHNEALSKHKQENDCAVKKINNNLDIRTRRSPSLTRGKSLEPIVEENSLRTPAKDQGILKGCDVVKVSGFAVEGKFSQPISSQADLSNRCEAEKFQFINGESNTGSLKRKKQFRTASLSDLLQESNEKSGNTPRINALDPLTFNYPKSSPELPSTSFAKSFHPTSSRQPVFTRLAVNKSISECNLTQWIGQPPLGNHQERQMSMPPEPTQPNVNNTKTGLRSSVSDQALNVLELDIIRNYMGLGLAPAEERLQAGGSNLSKGQVGEKWGGNCKIGELYDHEYGVRQGQHIRNNQRSTSLEPENLRWWADKGQNKHESIRTNGQNLAGCGEPDGYDTESGVSYFGEVKPVEGIFYAKPAILDSDSDSDLDTDDAQTVIFKSSPYSSPGLVLSRSASMTMTPLPLSPLTMTPQPPVSPDADSPPPPPRPPPPVNYTPSHDQFSSLPRNWRAKRRFFET